MTDIDTAMAPAVAATERHVGTAVTVCRFCGQDAAWLPVILRSGDEKIMLIGTDPDWNGRITYYAGRFWLRQERQLDHQDAIDAEAGRPPRNRYLVHTRTACSGFVNVSR